MAEHYANANETAIEEYERLIREKGIRCDFARCPAYLYTQARPELLKQETEAAASLGIYSRVVNSPSRWQASQGSRDRPGSIR